MQNNEDEMGYFGFSASSNGEHVRLVFDKQGRDELIEILQSIHEPIEGTRKRHHAHLFSSDWGTGDLDKLDKDFLDCRGEIQGHQIDIVMVGAEDVEKTFLIEAAADVKLDIPSKSTGLFSMLLRFIAPLKAKNR